jgi:hypothetical protein
MQIKGLGQLKNLMSSLETQPMTYWLNSDFSEVGCKDGNEWNWLRIVLWLWS